MLRLLELFCGTKSISRAFEVDIVSKFEPTILCDIRSWDYALFPPGHFDMVWASLSAQRAQDHSALRPAHVGHQESGHRAAEDHGRSWSACWADVGPAQEADRCDQPLEAEPRAVQDRLPV